MYLVPIFSPERWQSIGSSAPLSPPQERTVSRRRRETTKCASALNSRMIFGTAATTATQKFRRPDSKSFCRFRDAAVPRNRQTGSTENSLRARSVRTYTNFTSFRLSCGLRRSKNRETAGIFGTGCVIVIPSRATLSQLPPGQGFARHPRHSAKCTLKKRARFWCRNATKGLGLLGDARSALKRHLTH